MEINVERLVKRYADQGGTHVALDGVSLRVASGERLAVIGSSGSGKSTLLRSIAGLHAADSGSVHVGGRLVQVDGRLARDVRRLRARTGVISQQFNLVGRLSVLTNVLAGTLSGSPWWRTLSFCFSHRQRQSALDALERVGLADRADQRASTLSGGQQQRAAIARALVQRAGAILGDEPVASLDPRSAEQVLEDLVRINDEAGVTCLVSLHQVAWARRYVPRAIALAAGRVVYDGPTAELSDPALVRIYGPIPPRPVLPMEVAA